MSPRKYTADIYSAHSISTFEVAVFLLHFAGVCRLFPARAAICRSACVGGIVEKRTDTRSRDSLPVNIPMAIATGKPEIVLDEPTDCLGHRLLFEERGKDQVDAILYFQVGMLGNHAISPYQSGW